MLFHSHDAEEILKYQKLVDNILKIDDKKEDNVVILPYKIKLGAPELPRAGLREPRKIIFKEKKK